MNKSEHKFQRNDIDVRTGYLITHGYPTEDTINAITKDENIILSITEAEKYHPYALKEDYIIFYAKPINKEKYDLYMTNFRDAFTIGLESKLAVAFDEGIRKGFEEGE